MDAAASQLVVPAAAAADAGLGWWRAVGGTLAVFALLVLCLRLLSRWQLRAPRNQRAALLAVLPLGPRREVEVLRLGERVHYVYRREGALVTLGEGALADWQAGAPAAAGAAGAAPGWLARLLGTSRARDERAPR